MNGNPISSTAISVQMAYQYYIENKFIVNRKYRSDLNFSFPCTFSQ